MNTMVSHIYRIFSVMMMALCLVLTGCDGGSDQTAIPTPTTSLQGNFTTFTLNLPAEALHAPIKGPLPDDTQLHVGITFKLNQQTMNKLKASSNSGNLEAQANQLGISDATYQKLKEMFGVTDAKLTLDGLHTYLTIDGKAKTMAQTFQTTFVEHQLNGRTFYAPTSDPKIPTFIAPSVLAITGLDSYAARPQPHVSGHASRNTLPQYDCASAGQAMQWVAQAYEYDQFWKQNWHGEGMTVNLVELGPIDQQALQVSGKCFNSHQQIKTIDIDGGPQASDSGAEAEAILDVEMIQAFAPAANIMDYQTTFGKDEDNPWKNFNDTLRQIIKDNEKNTSDGSVISISYGLPETDFTQGDRAAIDQSLQILNDAEHMTVFVASGDCAAFDTHKYGTVAVDYPGVSPSVVDVGGTKMVLDQNNNRDSEEVWSDGTDRTQCTNQWGSGGGVSTMYPRPDWQKADGVENKYGLEKRQVPDVSAWAIQIPTYDNGEWISNGGTSYAAPIWAAGMVLVNQATIAQAKTYFNGPEIFYEVANNPHGKTPFYDVVKGSNLYYSATKGWDDATGLGTPNLVDFMDVLIALSQQ